MEDAGFYLGTVVRAVKFWRIRPRRTILAKLIYVPSSGFLPSVCTFPFLPILALITAVLSLDILHILHLVKRF